MLTAKATLAKGGACVACKLRKVKCTGTRPSCEACQRSARFRGEDPSAVICSYLKGKKCGRSGVGDDGTLVRGARHAKRASDEDHIDADVIKGVAIGAAAKRPSLLRERAYKVAARTASPRRSRLTTKSSARHSTESVSSGSSPGATSKASGQYKWTAEQASDSCAGSPPEALEPRASSIVPFAEPAKLFAAVPTQIFATTSNSEASSQYPTPLSSPRPFTVHDKTWCEGKDLEPSGGHDGGTGSAAPGVASTLAFHAALEPSSLLGQLQLMAAIPYFASSAPVPSQPLDASEKLAAEPDRALYTHAFLPTAHNISDTISLPFFPL